MEMVLNRVFKLTYSTFILIFFDVLYQILPCGGSSIRRFPCGKDRCESGVQYCVKEEQRCFICEDIIRYCDTEQMPLQCKAYCTGVKAVERETTLNATFENYIARLQNTSDISVEQHNRGYEIAVYILGMLVVLLSIIVTVFVYKYKRASRQDESSHNEKDMEETPFIPIPDINNHNSDVGAIQDNSQDGLTGDEKEVPAPSDVTTHDEDQSRRDSRVSDDSAVESMRSENVKLDEGTKENEESVPKTDLGNGSAKQCGPTRENPGTDGDGANMDGRQNTRNMNPTTGENAGTYEFVVNSSGLSSMQKKTVRPITQAAA